MAWRKWAIRRTSGAGMGARALALVGAEQVDGVPGTRARVSRALLEGGVAVGLVAEHGEAGLVLQELGAQVAVGDVGGGQGEVGDQPGVGGEQVEREAVDGLLLGGVVAVGGMAAPAVAAAGVGEADHGHGRRVDHAQVAPVGGQGSPHPAPEQPPQGPSGPFQGAVAVVAAALWQAGEERGVVPPQGGQQGQLLVLAAHAHALTRGIATGVPPGLVPADPGSTHLLRRGVRASGGRRAAGGDSWWTRSHRR